jgi:hypothetical protein
MAINPQRPSSTTAEMLLVNMLSESDRQLLRCGAVLRYITRDLAEYATGTASKAQQLLDHPFVQPTGASPKDGTWLMPEPLRRALVQGWEKDAEALWERVGTTDDEFEAIYALLALDRTRAEGRRRFETAFGTAVDAFAVGTANDLIRMLDEWPVSEHAEVHELRDRLAPRLRRHSRAFRDREATEDYFQRNFEHEVLDLFLRDGDRWMLHVHAPGGRGKSMFLKNLLGRICPERDIPVAWIDFDHIDSLGINTNEPWRLLLAVANQLDQQIPHWPFTYMLGSYGRFRATMHSQALPRHATTVTGMDMTTPDDMVVQAADEVPRKFRTELAEAVGNDLVVIAVDTVENVQLADGAEIDPVLAALAEVRHGNGSRMDPGVPGLRVIVSGRFDLNQQRVHLDGTQHPHSVVFHDHLFGPDPWVKPVKGTELRMGRQVTVTELSPFSVDEARRFLEKTPMDDDVTDAVIRKSSGNPMKLALFAEYVEQNPTTSAAEIDAFQSVELAYLVTRVVDRISNGLVQWLLRWGALMKILTKEAVDQIIWPALEQLLARGMDYDDATKVRAPNPAPGVVRWQPPTVAEVRQPGAAEVAWDELLAYAAHSSWVSTLSDSPDAVQFHPEVRDPLRNLLRSEGHPVFADIHRRALAYWQEVVRKDGDPSQSAALRSVVFHAYELHEEPSTADEVLTSLWDGGLGHADRAELADELLTSAVRLRESGSPLPSADVLGRAHLERAEALIHQASELGRAVDEGALSWHRHGINERVRAAQRRRTAFLDAVMYMALGSVEEAWGHFHSALEYPAPRDEVLSSLELMVKWAHGFTPPPGAIDTARLLHQSALEAPFARLAALPLARGLLSTERWTEALDVARVAESAICEAQALLALGRADEVLSNRAFPAEARAEAALLQFDAAGALMELQATPVVAAASVPSPQVMLLRGRAHVLRRESEAARTVLSQAASGADQVIALEANLLLSRLISVDGDQILSLSKLGHTLQGPDVIATLRAEALHAVVVRRVDSARSVDSVRRVFERTAELPWIQPSVQVDLECARLAVLGPSVPLLEDLVHALSRVDGAADRLRALRWLAEVPSTREPVPPKLASRLRSLTDVGFNAPVSLLLTKADLERVLGDAARASQMLDVLANFEARDPIAFDLSLADARHRLINDETGWRTFAPDTNHESNRGLVEREQKAMVVQISSLRDGTAVVLEESVNVVLSTGVAQRVEVVDDVLMDGPYALAADPDVFLTMLDGALTAVTDHQALEVESNTVLKLDIRDERSASLPWELAGHGQPRRSFTDSMTIVRTSGTAPRRSSENPVPVPRVYTSVLNERKDRGHLTGLMANLSGHSVDVVIGTARGLLGGEIAAAQPDVRIVHVVAEPIERRRIPALHVAGEVHLTPEHLASAIAPRQPTLLILDLVLQEADSTAAEQLMLANAFCWNIVRNAEDLSVLCGVFGGASDRIDHLRLLVDGLITGESLADLTGKLQRHRALLPAWRHPLRDFVSLSTNDFDRRFRLGSH